MSSRRLRLLSFAFALVLGGSVASGRQAPPPYPAAAWKVVGPGVSHATDGELLDLDGDGRLDHATVLRSGDLALSFGDGEGSFAPPVFVSVGADALDAEVADLDRDGDADLVIACASGSMSTVAVLLNDGSGSFTHLDPVPIGGKGGKLFVEDFDLDGELDALVALTSPFGARLLRGDGTGAFGPFEVISIDSHPLVAVDVDGDGDFDLAGVGTWLNVHRNDGSGAFGPAETIVLPSGLYSLHAADVDQDGDPDFIWSTGALEYQSTHAWPFNGSFFGLGREAVLGTSTPAGCPTS